MPCILCGAEGVKLTAEHIVQRSLVQAIQDLEPDHSGEQLQLHNHKGITRFNNLKKAKSLKPNKNLCGVCNSDRSTACDAEFERLIIGIYHWSRTIDLSGLYRPDDDTFMGGILQAANENKPESEHVHSIDEFRDRYGEGSVSYFGDAIINLYHRLRVNIIGEHNLELITKAIVKHAACFLDRNDLAVPDYLKNSFLNGGQDSRITYEISVLPPDISFGCQNRTLYHGEDGYKYHMVFSNVVVMVRLLEPLEDALVNVI